MTTRQTYNVLGAVAVCALVLASCRAEEQGRITEYQPGVYLGKKDTRLTEAQRKQLGQRTVYQSGSGYRAAGGGGGSASGTAVDLGALATRANQQRSP